MIGVGQALIWILANREPLVRHPVDRNMILSIGKD